MTVRSLRARLAIVAGCVWTALLVLMQPAAAQVTSASVAGVIRDSQGAVIPGATVTLTSNTRGTTFSAVSTAEGDFVFPIVEADNYSLRVTMDGFKTAERQNVVTHPGDRLALGVITIEVGAVTETINVAARATELQTQSAERNYAVEGEAVKNIAQNGRSFFGLAFLAPGVVSTNGAGVPTGDSATMSANGQRTNSNNVQIDGITDMDTGNNGGPMVALSLDSVQEVKLLTSNYQAEYGRSAGAQLTAVTKSGGREFHGSAYWFRRKDDLNANTWINNRNTPVTPVPKLDQRDLGYTIGGPVMIPGKSSDKSRLFFFFSQEFQHRLNPQTTPQRVRVPTALERQGDFSQTRDSSGNPFPYIRDYATGLPCSATDTRGCFQDGGVLGKIPASRLYQAGLNILSIYPQENSAGTIGQGFNYVTQEPTSQPERQDLLRMDWNASDSWRFNGKILNDVSNRLLPYGSFVLGTNLPPYAATYLFPRRGYSFNASSALNNSTFLEVTYGYSHNSIDILPGVGNEKNFTKSALGLSGLPTIFPNAVQMDFPPQFLFNSAGKVANQPTLGSNNAPFTNFNTTQDVTGSLTKLWGKHTAKAGLYYHHSLKPQSSFANANGQINFLSDNTNQFDTGFPFSNAATGVYSAYNQASGYYIGNYVYNNVEWYLQDNFKATNRLTLDYGLRFYWIQPQYDTKGQTANFIPSAWDASQAMRLYYPAIVGGQKVAIDKATGQTVDASNVGRLVPGSGNLLNGVFQANHGIEGGLMENRGVQYAPRFGFTYDMTGSQQYIVRGGGGVFYDRPQGNTVFDLLGNPPTTLAPTLNNGRLQDLAATSGSGAVILAPPSITAYDHQGKNPTVYAYNLGMQVKVPLDAVLDISYVGSQSRHLLQRRNINAPAYGAAYLPQNQDPTAAASTIPGATALTIDFLRPYSGFGNILLIEPSANSNYNSLQTSINRRFKSGLLLAASYTWSKGLGTVSTDLPGTGVVGSVRNDLFQHQANYAPLDFDRRHQFVTNFVYELPGNKSGALGWVVNNWAMSGVYRLESGAPYTIGVSIPGINGYTITGTQQLEGGRVVINGDPGAGYNASDPYHMFSTSVFSPPQPGSTGLESSRNYMNRAPTNNLDLSVTKRFRFGGNRALEARIDAFNALNHTQFLDVNSTMNVRSLTDPTITNLPYDSTGKLVNPTGFGTVSNTRPPRQVQLLLRFQF